METSIERLKESPTKHLYMTPLDGADDDYKARLAKRVASFSKAQSSMTECVLGLADDMRELGETFFQFLHDFASTVGASERTIHSYVTLVIAAQDGDWYVKGVELGHLLAVSHRGLSTETRRNLLIEALRAKLTVGETQRLARKTLGIGEPSPDRPSAAISGGEGPSVRQEVAERLEGLERCLAMALDWLNEWKGRPKACEAFVKKALEYADGLVSFDVFEE